MDLILLQFGADGIAAGDLNPEGTAIGTMIDGGAGPNWSAMTANAGGALFDGKKCIELVSVSQGIQQQVTTDVSNNARTSGRPVITDFTCVKYTDVTSPKMFDYCLRAKLLDDPKKDPPTMIWVLRNSGDQLNIIMRFELRAALISETHFQSHPNDMPTEQFKLNFTEIGWYHQVQGAAMTNAGTTGAAWSIGNNRPIAQITKGSSYS
ncbi:type VI secretion system tube protein Hcp [Vibrio gazogenes]|uniref:Type VI secretion system secreted protein Hcp n=1 Tax=Vibrio gazogenes DSM 21264 = NBRC 103151 TaxID=1123492 RepID=A0A1M4TEV2_VIBGA|nr:type VI secretion system tube protein Hcp [Vibrio gazogenes]USP16080.1 type VI secretion system tube protein Hcp [Vibrio gazogenes]SHE42986.1 type VI secretion system secreted protein Hcp [Vibrio gazogenes DSM 21264] [Vibrio gazogenes DSM 21264 = NBRC 103151]SJN54244.1 hypothetical protein BQ6471_00903 [Vibrio gazogenes]